jgi:hypothetical protein
MAKRDFAAAMPAMLLHAGEWDGTYTHLDLDGTIIDQHRTRTWCSFPDDGLDAYIQKNILIWPDGRTATYEFGGVFNGTHLIWDTDRFHGLGWQTHEDTVMLRLERRDTPGAYYVEMINLAPDGQTRARTWQWFKDGKPWKRTLCDEWRVP